MNPWVAFGAGIVVSAVTVMVIVKTRLPGELDRAIAREVPRALQRELQGTFAPLAPAVSPIVVRAAQNVARDVVDGIFSV